MVTCSFTVLAVGLSWLFGTTAAILTQDSFRGRGALRTIFLTPFALPVYASVIIWSFMFQYNNGLVNELLWFGAGQGARHAVVCLIGSGVGASIIGNGVTERAGASSGTEWGHTTIVVGGRDCRCGSLGHLEAYVGAEAILDRYGLPLPGDDEETALAALVALADTSPEAAKVLDETALYLGAGLADLINLYSPDQIILGGWAGLLLGHHLLPAIRASAREHALAHPFAETTITVGRLGPDAVARGAATLPIQAFLNGTAVPAARHPAAADEIRPTGTGRVG